MKPISIAALVVVPFVLFIAAGLVYQSQTGTDIVTGEKTGLAAKEVGQEQFENIYKNEPVQTQKDFDSHTSRMVLARDPKGTKEHQRMRTTATPSYPNPAVEAEEWQEGIDDVEREADR